MDLSERYYNVMVGRPNGEAASIDFYKPPVTTVDFISGSMNPMATLIRATRGYSGVYRPDMPTRDERNQFLTDLLSTPLGTPLEMVNLVFLIRGIPRSTTHQLVRTRIGASVVQESTRFLGVQNTYSFLITRENIVHSEKAYINACVSAVESYEHFLAMGMENQDARLILPHSILTNLFWGISLKTLMYVYRQRMCCNAETSVWVPLMAQIKKVMHREYDPDIAALLKSNVEERKSCGYDASFDRPCVWTNGIPLDELA